MKKYVLTFILAFSMLQIFAQTSGPNNPALGQCVPNSSCLGCPGSVWNNTINIYNFDIAYADVSLTMNNQCFQSTCFYSRFLYASNFGFAIPGTATIVGIQADIDRLSNTANTVTDSSVRLVLGGIPMGMNKADPNPWSTTEAYYLYGNSSDMWGLSWMPTDINAATFGIYLRVFNASSGTADGSVNHVRISVTYTLPTGGIYTQSSISSSLNVYQNDTELDVEFISNEQVVKGSLKIFNVLGELQMKRELTNVHIGRNSEKFASKDLAPGIYFVQLENGSSIQTKKFFIHD